MKLVDLLYRLGDRRKTTFRVLSERRSAHYRMKDANTMLDESISRLNDVLKKTCAK